VRRISCPLSEAARTFGDLPALKSPHESISYREYEHRVAGASRQIGALGVAALDRVAILLDNCVEYPILLFALFRKGAVACPLSTRLPESAVIESCARIGCRILITDRKFSDTGSVRLLPPTAVLKAEGQGSQAESTIEFDRHAAIVLTSGTSATPKAVVLTFGNLYFNARGSNTNIAFASHDRWLLSLPLYHVGGLGILFRAVIGGGTVVIDESNQKLEDSTERYEITHLSLVSTQLYRLVKKSTGAIQIADKLKAVLLGGGPFPKSLLESAVAVGLPIFTSYGMTEMASQVTTTARHDVPARVHTAGRTLRYCEVMVSADGEILVGGETLCPGYAESDRIVPAAGEDGWFHTRDVGWIDPEGYLTVTGRMDNMFVSGGESIQPEEIEAALLNIEGVERAIVVPVPNQEFGMRPVAFVMTGTGSQVDESELRGKLRSGLPGFKCPDRILDWPLDSTTVGIKPSRAEFARLACQKLGVKS
jgi:O-succinylbenzoic acid--CoA ligase